MKQQKHHQQTQEQLRQSIINQPHDPTTLQGHTADSFPQNKHKQRFRIAIAVVVCIIIGALAMRFLSSPERWIRL